MPAVGLTHHTSRDLNPAIPFKGIISALFSPPSPTCPFPKSAPFPAALPTAPQHSHYGIIPHSGWTWHLPSSNKPMLPFRDVLSELMSPVKVHHPTGQSLDPCQPQWSTGKSYVIQELPLHSQLPWSNAAIRVISVRFCRIKCVGDVKSQFPLLLLYK